ncbi:hypothetical protein FB107DRAFT_216641 [Schizophyllum commune]
MFSAKYFIALSLACTVILAQDYIQCETSDASPSANGCQTLVDGFKGGADPSCARPHGSGCHSLDGPGSGNTLDCSFVLCQQKGTQPQCSDPASAADFTQKLIDKCAKDGKVGGFYHQDLGDGHWLNYEFVKPE